MARFATPGDIAAAIAFLADPAESGFVNGHALSVDGGWFADGSWASLRRSKTAPATGRLPGLIEPTRKV